MSLLESNTIKLRALEPDDLDLLFSVENNTQFWDISNTLRPYSRDLLRKYLQNAHMDIFEAKQLRLVITKKSDRTILGLIDLFDFNPHHSRAGIGIIILKKHQKKGYAIDALEIFLNYAFQHLDLHQLYVNIPLSNKKSMSLFKKMQFTEVGIQKDWIKLKGDFEDVALMQIINSNHL